jgi:hypothetical protein
MVEGRIMLKGMSGAQWKVLIIRVILALVCAALLVRLFIPGAGVGSIAAAAGLLVVFAYVFEAVRMR